MKCNLHIITLATLFCLILGVSIEAKGNPKQSSVTIKGLVLDELNIPIIGANITEKGTLNGTISDVDGNFVLQVNNENAVLVVSYIGYRTVEQSVIADQQMRIVLSEDTRLMDEVVVIGYGTQKRADVTSSVSSVKSESFNKGAVLDAGQLVQGKVAGLQISLPTGDPTASTSVMLRGTSTLMGSTHPLILVDGVPGSFSTVAPEDIESIDVLKDGSATAIYGTRGTNGVIIITTKGGRRNMPTTIEYNGYVSISQQARIADFMSADDLRQRWSEGFEFSGANDQDYGHNTDWLGEVSRTGVSNVHNLTLRGGGAQSSTIATLTYDERQGTFKKSDSRNIRGRFEYIHRMFDDRLTANVSFIANERTTGAGFNSSVYRYATIQNPTQPIYDEQGDYVERPVYFYDNPVSILNETEGMTRSRNLRFTGSVEFRPIENLAIKGMYTKRGQSYLNGYYYTKKHPNTTEGGYNGYASRYTSDYLNDLAEFTVDWNIALEKHRIGVIAGYNYEASSSENFGVNNRDFPTDSYTYNKLESGMALSRGEAAMNSYKESEKLIGLFSRVTYNYDDRYLLMASIRREGSSKFGADHKWGNFPGISAGWRVNEEEFMEEYSWLDNLKFRAGYGITGINIGSPYVSLASLNYENYFMYSGEWINTLVPVRNPNPNLKWEKKYEYNIGLDFDMFNGRFGGAIDFYRRDTKDALWNYSVPVPPYQYGTITANVGQIRNTGLEILFNGTPVKLPSIEWNSNISFSTNKNMLVSIANDQFQMSSDWFTTGHTGEPIQTTTHRVKVGDPIGNFFGLKSVGFTKDGLWIVERLNLDEEGNIVDKYYDLGGEAELEDRQVLGNGVPKYYLNWNNQLQYKRFDLSISMRGAFGFEILNFQKMYYGNPTIQYNVLNAAFDLHDVVDMTTGEKTGEKVTINDSQRYVSEYVENGNYWKIDNVTLGYTFDLRRVDFINNLRFYVSCLNLATFTGYSGIDPEVRMTGLDAGIDHRDKYPTNRSFTFGVNISF
ncbi:MAG: SusC/RagA family TonB-linked outer membrane protein [Dysgonamonadaceae bacterium]|nr:SusC/RagA family TonB-linked outer membrane protein [Dysgonamonadaceae bacterium]